jgi:integrase
LENFREHFGEHTLLANMKYLDLETYRNHLRQKPAKGRMRTDAAVNRDLSCLRHLFNNAVGWEMIDASPFSRGRRLHFKENNKRLRFLSEDEIQRLLAECPKHLRRIVDCAINAGMRRGEILFLKWDQIRNGQIYLHKTKTNEAR